LVLHHDRDAALDIKTHLYEMRTFARVRLATNSSISTRCSRLVVISDISISYLIQFIA